MVASLAPIAPAWHCKVEEPMWGTHRWDAQMKPFIPRLLENLNKKPSKLFAESWEAGTSRTAWAWLCEESCRMQPSSLSRAVPARSVFCGLAPWANLVSRDTKYGPLLHIHVAAVFHLDRIPNHRDRRAVLKVPRVCSSNIKAWPGVCQRTIYLWP